jgi:hypothetical protein
VDSAVALDVNEIANLVRLEIRTELDHTMVSESTGEKLACTRTITERMWHGLLTTNYT